MQNSVILRGEVVSSRVIENDYVMVMLRVPPDATSPVYTSGEQIIPVRMPRTVLPFLMPLPVGVWANVKGILVGGDDPISLREFLGDVLSKRPAVLRQITYPEGVNPDSIKVKYPYSFVLAEAVAQIEPTIGLNQAYVEGFIKYPKVFTVSARRNFRTNDPTYRTGDRQAQRVVNYPYDPVGMTPKGGEVALYFNIAFRNGMAPKPQVQCMYDGALLCYQERRSLVNFFKRAGIEGFVLPGGLKPNDLTIISDMILLVPSKVSYVRRNLPTESRQIPEPAAEPAAPNISDALPEFIAPVDEYEDSPTPVIEEDVYNLEPSMNGVFLDSQQDLSAPVA